MLENSYRAVIAPEACASIIFRDSSRAEEAAESMKITARDLREHGIADEVLPEPLGGAHTEPDDAVEAVGKALERVLSELCVLPPEKLVSARYERYRSIGAHLAGQS
ncbi:MAG: acetyl-CoA carboxylase carboxyl transferase subunit alpha, partial [Rubrobacter sp.]|nr:acetyl-CoA carboxylase carboxyl transferase subunit alpha [Rubrobacter sp.]